MPRRYITETIQEKVPVLVIGEESAFRRMISRNIAVLYPDYEAVVVGKKDMDDLGITALPQVVVWIVSSPRQIGQDEAKVRGVVEAYQTRLSIIAPHDVNVASRLDGEFPRYLHVIVPQLLANEEGVNATIHQIIGGKVSGTVEVAFPGVGERVAVEPVSKENDVQTPVAKAMAAVLDDEPFVEKAPPMPSSWRTTVDPEVISAFQPVAVKPSVHIGFGNIHEHLVDPERPTIIEPPPPLFSHMPSEHDVITPSGGGWRVELNRKVVEVPGRNSAMKQEHDSLITNLFGGTKEKKPFERPTLDVSVPTAKKAKAKEKRRGVAQILMSMVIGLLVATLVCIAATVFIMKSFISAFDRFQDVVLSDSVDAELLRKHASAVVFQSKIVGPLNRVIQPLAAAVGLGHAAESFDEVYVVAQRELQVATELEKYSASMANIYAGVMAVGEIGTGDAIQQAVVDVDKAAKEVQLLTAELAKDSENAQIENASANSDGYKKLVALRRDLLGTQRLLTRLPSLLGTEKKKTYLVLIQNPLELRATGGFISAYALVTFDKGKLLDVQVQDSYVADDQLKGQVDPPADLQRFLGEKQWYFRDSNWDASFPQSAQQAQWFIEKELGVKTDGVLGLNMYSLAELMKVTGPVQLESYNNETVTAENLFERVQTKSELTFALNGETKKKEYLTSVAELVFEKLQRLDSAKAEKLAPAMLEAFSQGNLQASVNLRDDEQVLEGLGWNGKVMTPPCPQQFVGNLCFVDTIYEVDTNIGINRANYYVKKTVDHSIILTPEAAVHTYTMRFSNTAVSSAWPSGVYKNYVRLYIPDFTQVNSVIVNEKPISPSNMIQFEENGKNVVGFYTETPIGGTTTATVNYSTILSGDSVFSYAMFTQKQPGVEPYPLSFALHVQSPLVVKTLAPAGTVTGNVIQMDNIVDKPQYMAVELGKN